MLNDVALVGRISKEVKVQNISGGKMVAHVDLAVKRNYKNTANNKVETDFLRVIVWGNNAKNLAEYTTTGDIIGIKGRIEARSYEDQSGKRVFVTEIIAESVSFIQTKGKERSGSSRNTENQNPFGQFGYPGDEDLPF